MTTHFVRCNITGVQTKICDPVFKLHPEAPRSFDIDLPVWAVIEHLTPGKKPSVKATNTVFECLRFTLGFMGFSYCILISYGAIAEKGTK